MAWMLTNAGNCGMKSPSCSPPSKPCARRTKNLKPKKIASGLPTDSDCESHLGHRLRDDKPRFEKSFVLQPSNIYHFLCQLTAASFEHCQLIEALHIRTLCIL